MPKYCVEALEKFIVSTTYYDEAASADEAEEICKSGRAAYDHSSTERGEEDWLETVSVDQT